MNQAFVNINGVPTRVLTWGRWIEESKGNTNEIIVIIPGNPGVPGFYREFAKTLYERTEIPVWCVGHAGHNFADGDRSITKIPNLKDNTDLYNLSGQVKHKVEFFRKYVPNDAKVYLIAHSIGCYMTLEVLEHEDIKSRIEKAYCLFPAIELMAETRNGKFMNRFVRPIVWLVLFLTWIFTMLPKFLATFLLLVYMFIANVPPQLHTENIRDLLKPGILRRVFFLAFEELDVMKERNNESIRNNVEKLKFYYGKTDGWAPEQFCKDIKNDIPQVNADLTDINHTFVFNHSVDVACTVANWIRPKN